MPTTVLSDEIDVSGEGERAIGGDYTPTDSEAYMSEHQLDYFRRLLGEWKKSILSASAGTLQSLQDGPIREQTSTTAPRARRLGNRAAHPRSPAQVDRQDRFSPAPDRGRRIRLLRGNGERSALAG
jgi:hypothetical protein